MTEEQSPSPTEGEAQASDLELAARMPEKAAGHTATKLRITKSAFPSFRSELTPGTRPPQIWKSM